jgi:hypothetical protein
MTSGKMRRAFGRVFWLAGWHGCHGSAGIGRDRRLGRFPSIQASMALNQLASGGLEQYRRPESFGQT